MQTTPYGAWASPISPDLVTAAGVRHADSVEIEDGSVYWVESRPREEGRSVVVRRAADGTVADASPAGFNVRTRVHEYGGGAYGVHRGVIYATSFEDQRIHRFEPGGRPVPITPEPDVEAGLRYADFTFADRWMVAVRQRHGGEGEPVNELVRLPLDGSADPEVVASGHDFYAAPRLGPDGELAYLTWDHPAMPWDGTTLWVLAPGGEPESVAGGPEESVFQPEWSPGGVLHFASDRSGWWNLYRWDGAEVSTVLAVEADVGAPAWQFRYRRYGFLADGTILAVATAPEGTRLSRVSPGGRVDDLDPPGSWVSPLLAVGPEAAYVVAGSSDRAPGVFRIDGSTGTAEEVAPGADPGIDPAYLSVPRRIAFETPDGPAHAHHYPPASPDHAGPEGAAPPLLVLSHGGPTASASTYLDLRIQFWTSRGFAVVDVDYGGSAGYGRAYRQRLDGRWGIVDVRDCALAALHLVEEGEADGSRLAIRGGSAGGYTTLAVLAFRDDFAAGASHYGVADLMLLARHTHKFESRYLDRLVGPLPEAQAVYEERSPIHHAERITCPVILFQGLDDRVVPPEQATMMADALRSRGVPVAHVEFPGEGHGFRKAENQVRALEAELSFYGQVFGFEPPGVEPVQVEGI